MISEIEDHLGMIRTLKNDYKRSVKIMDYIYDTFTYTKNVTTVTTTGAQAFAMAKGVCQDYAHVMIGICRYFQILARYVSGMMIGEILDPLEGVVKEELYSECDGILFTLREYPVVSEGSLIGRILERQA